MIKAYWLPLVLKQEVSKNEFVYLASHRQWPGVLAQGFTIDEAVARWHENRQDRENDMDIHDVPFPESTRAVWCDHPVICYRYDTMTHVLIVGAGDKP